jgi:hypothetical protein
LPPHGRYAQYGTLMPDTDTQATLDLWWYPKGYRFLEPEQENREPAVRRTQREGGRPDYAE